MSDLVENPKDRIVVMLLKYIMVRCLYEDDDTVIMVSL